MFEDSMIFDYKPPPHRTPRDKDENYGTYLQDVEEWGTPLCLPDNIRAGLWPIPFDYFRFHEHRGADELLFGFKDITNSNIFKELGLCSSCLSANDNSDAEVIKNFLLKGKLPPKGEYRPIQEGILAVHPTDFLIVISSPNRFGDPGRMYIYRPYSN